MKIIQRLNKNVKKPSDVINIIKKIKGSKFLKFCKHNLYFTAGLIIFIALVIIGFGNFAPYDPRRWNSAPKEVPPCWKHPLGTTTLGQDLFWLLTYAIRNSLTLGITASVVGLIIGVILGLIAGYKGGLVEKIILFFADTMIVIPTLPLIILIASLIKIRLNMFLLALIIASINWSHPVRNVRAQILSLRERDFVATSLFSGSSSLRIMLFEFMPHILPWILSALVNRTINAIGTEITLAIFGLSTLGEATLGTLIYWADLYQALVRGVWWWMATPIIGVALLFLSLYAIAIGINEYLNPRARVMRVGV